MPPPPASHTAPPAACGPRKFEQVVLNFTKVPDFVRTHLTLTAFNKKTHSSLCLCAHVKSSLCAHVQVQEGVNLCVCVRVCVRECAVCEC